MGERVNDIDLLEKTELWVTDIHLEEVNLTELAAVVARSLGLSEDKVLVVDVRPDHVTFDILERELLEKNIIGKENEILQSISEVPGVCLGEEAAIHSNGILGLICVDSIDTEEVLERVQIMRNDIVSNINHRAIVFPTGFELEQKLIEDTNSPYIKSILEKHGFQVTVGDVIPDDEYIMTDRLEEAVSRGFGLIITSGGVGAEDKDHSVESVLNLDSGAAAPYITKYHQGQGRHVKDGVRISVGTVGISTLVTLPGPHDEVMLTMPVLIDSLNRGLDKQTIAERLAMVLQAKWNGNSSVHRWQHHSMKVEH